MPRYEESLTIHADPETIFAFASKAANMPKYLNTVKEAHDQGEREGNRSRIRMAGEANGHPYDADGWIEYEEGTNKMTWGSDGENDYSGQLQVSGQGDQSEVTVRLDFEPNPGQDTQFKEQMGSRDEAIRSGLRTSLQSLKNHLEGNGGKVASPADSEATLAPGR